MKKYTYNEQLIEKLNIKNFIEKYNFTNEKYNEAIFYALSSLYEHYKEEKKSTKSILLGDYYSFEYYNLLKDDLDKLHVLTSGMREGYFSLLKKKDGFREFSLFIISIWFSFYNLDFCQEDKELVSSI